MIAVGGLRVDVADDGTFGVTRLSDGRRWGGLFDIVDEGDRGDSYDISPVEPFIASGVPDVSGVVRRRHPSGILELSVWRRLYLPESLDPEDRGRRSTNLTALDVVTTATIAPGSDRVDVVVACHNRVEDHRLRLVFPIDNSGESYDAPTIAGAPFALVTRAVHEPIPGTDGPDVTRPFPVQGVVTVEGLGLGIAAPGIVEWEADGFALRATLFRSVGWLSRGDLPNRPAPLGPAMRTPDAQLQGPISARFSLIPYDTVDSLPRAARIASVDPMVVVAGPQPRLPAGEPVLLLDPAGLVLTALKPAEDGRGLVARVWNPTGEDIRGRLRVGFPIDGAEVVTLLEEPTDEEVTITADRVGFDVPARSVRSISLLSSSPPE